MQWTFSAWNRIVGLLTARWGANQCGGLSHGPHPAEIAERRVVASENGYGEVKDRLRCRPWVPIRLAPMGSATEKLFRKNPELNPGSTAVRSMSCNLARTMH